MLFYSLLNSVYYMTFITYTYLCVMPRSYSIVAPKAFRTGSIYNMTVSCYRATGSVFVTIRLTGQQNRSLVEQTEVLANGALCN